MGVVSGGGEAKYTGRRPIHRGVEIIHRKIAGPMRVQATGTQDTDYYLDPSPGGSRCKVILWSIKVIAKSSADVKLGLDYQTGPDGDVFGGNKPAIALNTVAGTAPLLIDGASGTPDTDPADVLGEWVRVRIQAGTASAGDEWATIEVWETRKPF